MSAAILPGIGRRTGERPGPIADEHAKPKSNIDNTREQLDEMGPKTATEVKLDQLLDMLAEDRRERREIAVAAAARDKNGKSVGDKVAMWISPALLLVFLGTSIVRTDFSREYVINDLKGKVDKLETYNEAVRQNFIRNGWLIDKETGAVTKIDQPVQPKSKSK